MMIRTATYQSYIICTSPRSGSTLLCKLLAATGVAGNPASYFYQPSVDNWAERMGVAPSASQTENEILEAVIAAAVREGRGGTGVFGLRQQARSFDFLRKKLALLYPNSKSDADLIQNAFGPTLLIHLTRADKLRQAVSFLMAEQTGLWHMAPDGSELERTKTPEAPRYDRQQISMFIETLTGYDRDWNSWFADQGIDPLVVDYDALSENPGKILRVILGQLGVDRDAAANVIPEVKKLANSVNEEWVARYHAEAGSL